MTPAIVLLSTVPTAEEAEKIATALVSEKLAACVQILPAVSSFFFWEGKVTHAAERLLLIKSIQPLYDQIQKRIIDLHSYEIPEIIALPIFQGSEAYLRWIEETCGSPKEPKTS